MHVHVHAPTHALLLTPLLAGQHRLAVLRQVWVVGFGGKDGDGRGYAAGESGLSLCMDGGASFGAEVYDGGVHQGWLCLWVTGIIK